MSRLPDMVRLLDVDPDLGGLLNDSRREQAERELVVRTHRLPVGPWDVSRLAGATADHVGLLIIDGILSRELIVADTSAPSCSARAIWSAPGSARAARGCCPWTRSGPCSPHRPWPCSIAASRPR